MRRGRILASVGLAAAVAAVVVAGGVDGPGTAPVSTTAADSTSPAAVTGSVSGNTAPAAATPPVLRPAPTLKRLDGWLQADISSLGELRGRVVILQFWTFGCSNCRATLPHLADIYSTYRSAGLEIVGVHSPEFDYEKDPDAILEAAERLGVTWPIALDTAKVNFHAWQEGATAYWPRTYVIDQQGQIRFDHIGEGAYDDLEATVAALLAAS
jgi:thiol-disulfide isomerase/thioredoxin